MKRALVILLFWVATSCSKKEISQPQDQGLDYYPLVAGRYSIYEIDSIVYNEIPRDTFYFRYRIKEVLTDTFSASDGTVMWKLERYIKTAQQSAEYDSIPWQPKDVWYVEANKLRVIVAEENHRFTRLVFPVQAGKTWDGNAGNTNGKSNYRYDYTDQPESIGTFHFEKTLKVTQRDFRTLISYELKSEKYARGTGLIFKEHRELFSNDIVPGKPVEDRIEHGVVFTQSLIAHGFQ